MLKKFLGFLAVLFSVFIFAQEDLSNTEERILSFHSDIVVNDKGGISVAEHIKVYASGSGIQHGIIRSLPESRNLNGKNQTVRYTDISVTKNGQTEEFHEGESNGNLQIFAGKKEVFLTPGIYDYVINYKTENQIGFFKDYDEFYWNVNGLGWDFPAEKVSATITLPNAAKIIQNSCYTGEYESKAQDCTFEKISDHVISFSGENFASNAGLTVAVGFNKGVILPPPPPTTLEKYGILGVGVLAILGLFGFLYSSWNEYGRDPDAPTVYPQFNPPNNLSPASFGYFKDEIYSTKLVTAAVVSLAIKGFIKITESTESKLLGLSKSKVYTLTKIKTEDETLPAEEQEILKSLFDEDNDSVTLDDTYDSGIESMVNYFKGSLSHSNDALLMDGNNQKKLIAPFLFLIIVYVIGLMVSFFIDPDVGNLVFGGLIFIVLTVVFFFLQYLGRFKKYNRVFWLLPAILIINGIFKISTNLPLKDLFNYSFCYYLLSSGFGGLMIYSFLIRKPAPEKLAQNSLIDGFEMYLSAAEKEVMKFHNPPQMTPQIFEQYLPYAMVLGVDGIWGKKFESALSSMNTSYQNNWYIGGTFQNMMFASAFSQSMTNSLSSAATPPSSSGSGSGGGGFSGGGGGGGGGGGW